MDTLSTGWIQSAAVEEQKSGFRDFPLPFVMYKRIASSLRRRCPTSTSTMEDDGSNVRVGSLYINYLLQILLLCTPFSGWKTTRRYIITFANLKIFGFLLRFRFISPDITREE